MGRKRVTRCHPEGLTMIEIELDFKFDGDREIRAEEVIRRFVREGALCLRETRQGMTELIYIRGAAEKAKVPQTGCGPSLLISVEGKLDTEEVPRAYTRILPGRPESTRKYLFEILDLARRVGARVYDCRLETYVTEGRIDEIVTVYIVYVHIEAKKKRLSDAVNRLAPAEKARRRLKRYQKQLKQEELIALTVEYLDLSTTTLTKLKDAGISHVGELVRKTAEDLRTSDFGDWSVNHILAKLEELGLSLGMTLNNCLPKKSVQ
jgi:hypothetical protein